MISAQYDIFRKSETELVWIEVAHDLSSAQKRMTELAEENGGQYVVYDLRAKRIVATSVLHQMEVEQQ
jgi:hypothetical protein